MASESRTAIYAGIGANLLIAITKFTAAAFGGSSAMVAEGVHSLVDTADGLLLLLGQARARRPADDAHPLGHGKELYFWSLIVAVLFFALGAGMSFYEGVQHILRPEPISDPTWSYVVLGASAIFTLGSFTAAFRPFRRRAAGRGYWKTFRGSKDPTLFTLVLEDVADLAGLLLAFLGVFLGHRLDNPYLDGAASLGIGIVMAVVAALLARESKGLLIGEAARPGDLAIIHGAAEDEAAIVAVRRPVTMYFGPHSVLVAMDVEFKPALSTAEIAAAVNRLEGRIRAALPDVQHIYIEARSLSGPGQTAPRTPGRER
jgi:cation diffusion facilitator family transporter